MVIAEYGTLDGSTDYILESATGGMYSGSKTGAGVGFMSGVSNLITNPEGFCFVAGTVVMTAVGLVAIEDLQPGDVVYSMVAAGEEQQVDLSQELDRKVILETYAHEVDETYVVTIDGESIEATPEHPFYNAEGEEVQAKDLKEGDELATANGDTATVDSVECIHYDEPVMVYNFAVCDSHTYFVGENHVLVHNMCPPKRQTADQKALKDLAEEAARNAKAGNPISGEEARVLDRWAEEFNVPQHHQSYPGSGEHFPGGGYMDHTHIYNVHVPYVD